MKFVSTLLLYLLLLPFSSYPQHLVGQNWVKPFEFERLDEKSGSNASDIYRIYQDKTGFIWICAANGLFRYDGKVFLPVKNEEGDPLGLGDDHVYRLFEDSANRLWAITEFGELYLYNQRRSNFFRFHINYEAGCNSEKIAQLIEGPSGQLYVISNSYGLCLFDVPHAILSPLSITGANAKKVFRAIADPVQKNLWAHTADSLYAFREEKSAAGLRLDSAYDYANGTSTVTMELDKGGNLWLGGWYPELAKLNVRTGTFELFKFTNEKLGKDKLNHNRVNTICFDDDGKVWAGTNAGGAFILDPLTRSITMIQHDEKNESSLSHNTVTKILRDKDGNVWISTWGNGLNKYIPARTQFGLLRCRPNLKNALGSLQVSTFYEMDSNLLWIGSNDGLNLLNRKTGNIQFFKIPGQISKGQVCSIYAIQPGPRQSQTLWLGTSHGLLFFDPNKKAYTKWRAAEASELPVEQELVYFIDRTEDQGYHLLTYGPYTLFHYNTQTKRFVRDSIIEKTIQDPNLIAVFDRQHHLWMSVEREGYIQVRSQKKTT
ncbi:MAG: hypothetical protein IPN29_02900 [Saprospiraceae bacterium]|nr:hypothetical protein [Saprospiraceae bacterium]